MNPAAKLAERLFDAERNRAGVEDEVDNLLTLILGDGYDHFTHDWYDASIEIYGVGEGVALTLEQRSALWDAGFSICWTHTELTRSHPRHEGERCYSTFRDGEAKP